MPYLKETEREKAEEVIGNARTTEKEQKEREKERTEQIDKNLNSATTVRRKDHQCQREHQTREPHIPPPHLPLSLGNTLISLPLIDLPLQLPVLGRRTAVPRRLLRPGPERGRLALVGCPEGVDGGPRGGKVHGGEGGLVFGGGGGGV